MSSFPDSKIIIPKDWRQHSVDQQCQGSVGRSPQLVCRRLWDGSIISFPCLEATKRPGAIC